MLPANPGISTPNDHPSASMEIPSPHKLYIKPHPDSMKGSRQSISRSRRCPPPPPPNPHSLTQTKNPNFIPNLGLVLQKRKSQPSPSTTPHLTPSQPPIHHPTPDPLAQT